MADFIKTYTEKDKLIHMIVCAAVTLYCYCILHTFLPKWYALPASALVSLIIGALKEIFDHTTGKGVSSVKDFIADCIGTVGVILPLIFI